jgi:hypothetical protein
MVGAVGLRLMKFQVMYFSLKGLYCSVSLYNKQGMYNCSVYQLKNYSLRSCRELAICTAMAGKGDSSENILHSGKNTAGGGFKENLE